MASDTGGDHQKQSLPRFSRRGRFDARPPALAIFLIATAALLCAPRLISYSGRAFAAAQSHTQTRRTPPRRAPAKTTARDYSRFSHSSESHLKRDCAACHHIASFEQPDIKDFPDHPACVECHRQQFFRGARPLICSNCHTVVSPRTAARFPFPNVRAGIEFADVFPHANHIKSTSLIQFKNVVGEKSSIQATCLYCHKVNAAKLAPAQGATASAFAPPAGTFMTTPTSHSTCFQCHWQKGVAEREQEPYAVQCASCHRNISVNPLATALSGNAPVPVGVNGAGGALARIMPAVLTSSPRVNLFPARVVPKFVHELEAHKKRVNDEGKEVAITCLQCHTGARRAATLEGMRLKENRVGLPNCSSSACHTATTGAAQLPLSVYRELRERGKDAKFDCALCHTPPSSARADAPCSHYAAVYAGALREKKGTKGIEQLTPPRCGEELKKVAQ